MALLLAMVVNTLATVAGAGLTVVAGAEALLLPVLVSAVPGLFTAAVAVKPVAGARKLTVRFTFCPLARARAGKVTTPVAGS